MLGRLMQAYQFIHMVQSHHQQRLSWQDAARARVARDRAEALAEQQAQAMTKANPSGELGASSLDDVAALKRAGLL